MDKTEQNEKSILNAPKQKFLIPSVMPSHFILDMGDNTNNEIDYTEINLEKEINCNELNLSSSSFISSDEEEEKRDSEYVLIKKSSNRPSQSSADTKGTDVCSQ